MDNNGLVTCFRDREVEVEWLCVTMRFNGTQTLAIYVQSLSSNSWKDSYKELMYIEAIHEAIVSVLQE